MPRDIPASLASHLQGRVLTLAVCWRVETLDAQVFAYTTATRTITIDGVDYKPRYGIAPTAIETTSGTGIDNLQVVALLSDDEITEEALMGGVFDGATVEVLLTNWNDPENAVVLHRGTWGDTTLGRSRFEAELRGILQRIAIQIGRVVATTCDADLGDARCGYAGTLTYAGKVVTHRTSDRVFRASSLNGAGFVDEDFVNGLVTFTSGANSGLSMEVKSFDESTGEIELQQAMPYTVALTDVFTIKRGCDKRWITCKATYSNAVNFRGFPHITGIDKLLRLPGGAA